MKYKKWSLTEKLEILSIAEEIADVSWWDCTKMQFGAWWKRNF